MNKKKHISSLRSVYLLCMFICLPSCMHVYLFVYLSVCMFSVCLTGRESLASGRFRVYNHYAYRPQAGATRNSDRRGALSRTGASLYHMTRHEVLSYGRD